MKTILCLLVAAFPAIAQTNLGTITFTNRHGEVVSNAAVTKVEAAELVYSLSPGGGRVKLADLPEDLRRQFGYDPEKAALAEAERKEKLARQSRLLAAQADQAATEQQGRQVENDVIATATIIDAEIRQHIKEGLLLNCKPGEYNNDGGQYGWESFHYPMAAASKKFIADHPGIKPMIEDADTVLLEDFYQGNSLADKDGFSVVGFPIGTFQYTTVAGGSKTVRRYTTDFFRATRFKTYN